MRRTLTAVTLVALLAGCGIPRLARQPGSDIARPESGPRKITTSSRCASGTNGVTGTGVPGATGVTGVSIGGDRVSVSTCRSVTTDTAPDATLDGRTPRPPVP
jgi:hypothetical protein